MPTVVTGVVRVGERVPPGPSASVATALARPKSNTLTMPSGVGFDFEGLEVPVDDPLGERSGERSGDSPADPQHVVEGKRSAFDALRQGQARHVFEHEEANRAPLVMYRP